LAQGSSFAVFAAQDDGGCVVAALGDAQAAPVILSAAKDLIYANLGDEEFLRRLRGSG